ncbi:hypothetical protein [Granulicella sp. S190]|uniref:hypothetical protein n=1 Tax=Granulicella sp. S190 TaxID=1747226 RepID=UPI00131AEDE7|nr:hypothetical protein [Granulicella sp. S190]
MPVKQLILLGKPGGLEYWIVPCPLGARPDSYDALRQFLESLVAYMSRELGCSHESFIALSRKADPSAKFLFAENARHWNPETGLGVLPHQPPPRMIRAADVSDLDPENLPQVMHTLFRVKKAGNVRLNAMTTMLGTGSGLQILSRLDGTKLLNALKDEHLELIEDPLYRIFPWYVPLLDKAALDEPLIPRTIEVTRRITLYIRESPEDGGVLIISSEPLTGLVEQFGCKQLDYGKNPQWTLEGIPS